jgi:uncharacterized membrane protein
MAWMQQMESRDLRIIDTQIMGSLQSGTAFFASTSLIAIGGTIALLRAADNLLQVFGGLPLAPVPSRGLWDTKVIGLAIIFIYAFMNFRGVTDCSIIRPFSWARRRCRQMPIAHGGI